MSTSVAEPSSLPDPVAEQRDALLNRLAEASLGFVEVCSVYLGDRLGYYDALTAGPASSTELAERTGTHERYAREWLEQQTVAELLELENPGTGPLERRFRLPAAHAEVLTDRGSLNYWTPIARMALSCTFPIQAVIEAYRSGGGVPFEAYGADLREGLADAGRVASLELIGTDWFPAIPALHERLQADPPARVADVGCGAAWTSIGIAKAYPKVRVDGFDLDPDSVELARRNVAEMGLRDRVRIELRNAADPQLEGQYDVAFAASCIHDMSNPVAALKAMKQLTGEHGLVIVLEGSHPDEFLGEGTVRDVERKLYCYSILHCLPVAMTEQPSAAMGTVMRPNALRQVARAAGFSNIEMARIDDWTALFHLLR